MPNSCVLGIDVGGTKIAAGVVAPDGTLLSVAKIATAGRSDREALWEAVAIVGDQALEAAGVDRVVGVGCGCAGPMLWPEGVVSPSVSPPSVVTSSPRQR